MLLVRRGGVVGELQPELRIWDVFNVRDMVSQKI